MSENQPADSAATSLYERLRKKASRTWKRRKTSAVVAPEGSSAPFGPGRDPQALGDVVAGLTVALGWSDFLVESDVIASWPEIVGEDVALHSRPVQLDDGILTVECESTAWATQLRMMASLTLSRIIEIYPDAGISSVVFKGPNAPTWKRGNRSVPGRGPRDTYG
jgi:predicted nucleic acid-binding Zn ribbon protein